MIKLSVCADVQTGNHKQFAKPWAPGLNTRFRAIQKALMDFLLYSVEYRIDATVIAGDLFSQGNMIDTPVFNDTYRLVSKLAHALHVRDLRLLHLIVGNHDMPLRVRKVSALESFSEIVGNGMIITERGCVTTVGSSDVIVVLTMVPFSYDTEEMKQSFSDGAAEAVNMVNTIKSRTKKVRIYKVLISHCAVSGAKVGPSDVVLKDELSLKDICAYNYDLVLLGHYHKRQEIKKNVFYVGSLLQHDFGEANDESKGFVVVTFDTGGFKLSWIPSSAPSFVVVDYRDFLSGKTRGRTKKLCAGNYVWLKAEEPLSPDDIKFFLKETGPLDFKFTNVAKGIVGKSVGEIRNQDIAKVATVQEKLKVFLKHNKANIESAGLSSKLLFSLGSRLIDGEVDYDLAGEGEKE